MLCFHRQKQESLHVSCEIERSYNGKRKESVSLWKEVSKKKKIIIKISLCSPQCKLNFMQVHENTFIFLPEVTPGNGEVGVFKYWQNKRYYKLRSQTAAAAAAALLPQAP